MAHNLMTRNGRVAMLAGRDGVAGVDAPWHGLGQRLPALATKDEALRLGGLEWRTELAPLSYESATAEGMGSILIPNRKAILGPSRDDGTRPVFGVVSNKFTPFQNSDLVEFAASVVGIEGAIFDTAGALGDGERVFVSVKVPGDFEVVPGDEIKPYILFSLGHDGTKGLDAVPTNIRVVCQNTLSAAMAERGTRYSTTHSGDIAERVKKAREVLALTVRQTADFADLAKRLAAVTYDRVTEDEFLRRVLPISGAAEETKVLAERETVRTLAHEGIGQEIPGVEGTAWGLWNGYTEWADFYRSGMGERADGGRRFESAAFGESARGKSRALATLVDLVGAAK